MIDLTAAGIHANIAYYSALIAKCNQELLKLQSQKQYWQDQLQTASDSVVVTGQGSYTLRISPSDRPKLDSDC